MLLFYTLFCLNVTIVFHKLWQLTTSYKMKDLSYINSSGHEVYNFDIKTKVVKKKVWDNLPVCTSTFRWLEHYYCFHGHNFTRFHPVSGKAEGNYPKETRRYFMSCPNLGVWLKNVTKFPTYIKVISFPNCSLGWSMIYSPLLSSY